MTCSLTLIIIDRHPCGIVTVFEECRSPGAIMKSSSSKCHKGRRPVTNAVINEKYNLSEYHSQAYACLSPISEMMHVRDRNILNTLTLAYSQMSHSYLNILNSRNLLSFFRGDLMSLVNTQRKLTNISLMSQFVF